MWPFQFDDHCIALVKGAGGRLQVLNFEQLVIRPKFCCSCKYDFPTSECHLDFRHKNYDIICITVDCRHCDHYLSVNESGRCHHQDVWRKGFSVSLYIIAYTTARPPKKKKKKTRT